MVWARNFSTGYAHSRSKQRTDQRVLIIALKFLALKKVFPCTNYILPKTLLTFVYLYSMQLFSTDPTISSRKNQINFLPLKTLKNRLQKLLIFSPNLFFTVQFTPEPTTNLSPNLWIWAIFWIHGSEPWLTSRIQSCSNFFVVLCNFIE